MRCADAEHLPAVEFTDVTKRFSGRLQGSPSLRERFIQLIRGDRLPRRCHFSLSGLNLRIDPGESVAFIGNNGSGKTTALRLISGIYRPTAGVVRTRGRLASILGLGVGFNRELTGEENVQLYGTLMGLNKREITELFPKIVSFAEVDEYIDQPVKFYSTGMVARLAFSVAAHLEPDILLLDEILAVGDRRFRVRCHDRLRRYQAGGGTLIVVSHELGLLRELCHRAIWFDGGHARMDGDVNEVIACYQGASPSPAGSVP